MLWVTITRVYSFFSSCMRSSIAEVAIDSSARHEVVHPVEAADERALATAGRTDDGRDQIPVHVEVDAADRGRASVRDSQAVDVKDHVSLGRRGRLSLLSDLRGPHVD